MTASMSALPQALRGSRFLKSMTYTSVFLGCFKNFDGHKCRPTIRGVKIFAKSEISHVVPHKELIKNEDLEEQWISNRISYPSAANLKEETNEEVASHAHQNHLSQPPSAIPETQDSLTSIYARYA